MTKEIIVERQEGLAPAPEAAYLRTLVEDLRRGNTALLKENHRLKEELAKLEAERT